MRKVSRIRHPEIARTLPAATRGRGTGGGEGLLGFGWREWNLGDLHFRIKQHGHSHLQNTISPNKVVCKEL
mgnify:CR=1 FL=1